MNRPTLVLVDDHEIVREGLIAVLAGDFDVVAAVGTAAEATDACSRLQPDLVILDVRLPDRSGLASIADVLAVSPRTGVVVLSAYEDPAWARQAMQAGASGYLVKDAERLDLVRSLRDVLGGKRMVDPRLAAAIDGGGPGLTARELEVLELIAAGWSNPEIAAQVHLSTNTVKEYVSAVLRKLEARSRADAVRRGIEGGLLASPLDR